MGFTVQHESGWYIEVLDSAMRHLAEVEVRAALASPVVRQAIEAASATGEILHWNGGVGHGELVLPSGVRILMRHAHADGGPFVDDGRTVVAVALLVVYHADRGDAYKAENLTKTQDRFSGSGSYLEMMRARNK